MPAMFRQSPSTWWLVLMMVLLPLRGWAGTTMAVHMAAATAVQSAARLTTQPAPDDMPSDCPMRAGTSSSSIGTQPPDVRRDAPAKLLPDSSGDSAGQVVPACSGCDTCELCVAMASFTAPAFSALPDSLRFTTAAVPHGFVSADRALRLKPPIS